VNTARSTDEYTYRVRPLKDGFVAYSREMNMCSKGSTVSVAVSALRAAIEALKG
jgi:hypothetical protein